MEGDRVPCKHIFSNGTEHEIFMEQQCYNGCTRYRNGKCRVFNAIALAYFMPEYFPYEDLLDCEGYGNKYCKHYTTEPIERHKNHKLQEERGQITWI